MSSNGTSSLNDSCSFLDVGVSDDGGIPLILGINVAVGALLLLAFVCLHMCFKDFAMAGVYLSKGILSDDTDMISDDEDDDTIIQRRRGSSLAVTKDICESIIKFITLSGRRVKKRIGNQASIFLTLQLYFLCLLCVYGFFSIVIILPLNTSGKLQKGVPFATTTLSNVSPESPLLWVHTLFAILYFLIGGSFFIHFILKHEDMSVNNDTVMVTRVPKYVHVEDLSQHFEEIFDSQTSPAKDIKFAYDTEELYKTWKKLKVVLKKLESAEAFESQYGVPLMIRTSNCSNNRVNAREYYTEKLHLLQVRLSMERQNALNTKLPITFVSFEDEENANVFVDKYRWCQCGPSSSLTDSIRSNRWSVSIAPQPSDILWNNLSKSGILWWCRWIVLNFALILFLIFFTTPAVLLNSVPQLELFRLGENITSTILHQTVQTPSFLRSYWSSFLLIIFGILLLFVVTKSVYLECHWSRTQRELVVLRKAYIYKTLQAIVLPSIGLTSLSAVGNYLVEHRTQDEISSRLSCVFLPNNGAFFISYVIIATFISNPLELLRIPQLITYFHGRFTTKSKYDRREILRKVLVSNFNLGIQYAYSLLMFSLTVTFSLSVPLIVPFGILFFVFKYFTDKYNLLYGYRRLPDDNNVFIHKTAIKIAIIGVSLVQWLMLAYSIVRTGTFTPRAITTLVIIVLCNIVMGGMFMYGWFSYLIPKIRSRLGYSQLYSNTTRSNKQYIAPVLAESVNQIIKPELSSSISQTYESFGRTIAGGEVKGGSPT